jgi:hypothetical protein
MKIRQALTGVAAAAVLVMGGSVAAVAEAPAVSGPVVSHAGVTAHNIHADGATAAPAAATTTGVKNFVNGLYGNCLDDSSTAGLRMYTCSDASYNNGYQKWTVADNAGLYQFKNAKTGLCLDGSSTAGLRGYTCSSASYDNGYQKWVIYWENSDGTWVDWENVATGKCMDYSSTAGLRLYTCSGASYNNGYQMWND